MGCIKSVESHKRTRLNIRCSYQHIVTDLYAFIATAIAVSVIMLTGFLRADSIASLIIAALMFRAAYGLTREAGGVLLEAAPAGMDADEVVSSIVEHPLLARVHEFRLWEITSGEAALPAHVLCREGEDCDALRRDLEEALATLGPDTREHRAQPVCRHLHER
jgi:cobalt-zinc-cadmium efflux system protein